MKRKVYVSMIIGLTSLLSACGNTEYQMSNGMTSFEVSSESQEEEPVKEKFEVQDKTLGDDIDLTFVSMTIEKLETAKRYDFEYIEDTLTGTSKHSSYIEPSSGMKLVTLRGKFKNKTNHAIYPSNEPIYAVFTINENNYKAFLECYDVKRAESITEIVAQQTVDYFLYVEVPVELADNIESCILQFGFVEGLGTEYVSDISDLDYVYKLDAIPSIK